MTFSPAPSQPGIMGKLGEQHAEHAENDQTDKPKEKPVTTHDAFFLGGHGAWCKGRTAKIFSRGLTESD